MTVLSVRINLAGGVAKNNVRAGKSKARLMTNRRASTKINCLTSSFKSRSAGFVAINFFSSLMIVLRDY